MKTAPLAALLLLADCAPAPAPDEAQVSLRRSVRTEPAISRPGRSGELAATDQAFEVARGSEATQRVRAASSSVVAVFRQGLPRPITGPDGRTTFAGPSVNAVMRENGRWLGWKTGRAEPVPAAVAARLDSILADPALWREPTEFPGGGCTDAGSLELVIRHQQWLKLSRQDNCDSRGLAGELGRLVLDERVGP